MKNTIKELSAEININANKKGFWEGDAIIDKMIADGYSIEEVKAVSRAFRCQKLMLIVTELAEACEADRADKFSDIKEFEKRVNTVMDSMNGEDITEEELSAHYAKLYKVHVKDTYGAELAGTMIRVMDLAKQEEIDLEAHVIAEHRYNLTRPVKHGKNY